MSMSDYSNTEITMEATVRYATTDLKSREGASARQMFCIMRTSDSRRRPRLRRRNKCDTLPPSIRSSCVSFELGVS